MPIHCEFDITQRTLNFPRPFVEPPRLAHGLRVLDIGDNANIRVSSILQHITKSSADCNIITRANTTLYHAVANVFALAPCDLDFLTGEHMCSFWKNPNDPASVRIDFERPFVTPPKVVVVFFNRIEFDKDHNWRVVTTASNIDAKGFTLNIETWSDTVLYAAQTCWIAYPEDRERIFSTSVSTMDIRPWDQQQLEHSGEISFTSSSVEFFKKPSAFIALNHLDVDCKADLRINAYVDPITTTRLVWHIDSWDDTVLYAAGATIIAFN
ncbi:hypothetical protein EDB86DRAFT_2816114 [Lactarius hatsudake]|nr:hypothetical protein EDB86DRAFT_2816114 [Lactarius hatsudake]